MLIPIGRLVNLKLIFYFVNIYSIENYDEEKKKESICYKCQYQPSV